ncbi:hypothetical protein AB0F11_02200 [Streptomyces sp. NPDC032472]|uniref:hypothetical protein n=1 Tax=Streptomyces sp. NPDC032472 TaxID=3155018 RepID=UPI0034105E16
MTAQNAQPSTATPATQGSFHWVLTLEVPGRITATQFGTWNVRPGSTRHDVFLAIRQEVAGRYPELANANVMFFALEPNQL